MIGIDGSGKDGGGRREDIPINFSPSFHFFLFLSFSFFFSFIFPFLRDVLRFQKNLHEIRIWRIFYF